MTAEALDKSFIESEVQRLGPWYYAFDLEGVRTDVGTPCDRHGFRKEPRLPDAAALEIAGASVLDCACNEGGYSFSAAGYGARLVQGFDVRSINVEKARFVAAVRGIENVRFETSSCDEWVQSKPDPFDYVFLCGLLYHLPDPARTIGQFSKLARRGVFLTCVLHGGDDGYTPFPEQENIAASEDPSEMSQMPNTSRTIVREFARHGFHPVHLSEQRGEYFWGGCSLFFRRLPEGMQIEEVTNVGADLFDLHVALDATAVWM